MNITLHGCYSLILQKIQIVRFDATIYLIFTYALLAGKRLEPFYFLSAKSLKYGLINDNIIGINLNPSN